MKRFILSILLLASVVGVSAQETSAAADTSHTRYRLSAEVTLAPGLNDYAPRAVQVAVLNSLSMGRYLTASLGIGLRHTYTMVEIDKNIYGYGEPDQVVYGDRLLLPFFARVKGTVPVGAFSWLETRFVPYAQIDAGYAVDLQQSVRQRTVSGAFLEPALGLDMKLKSGRSWYLTTGIGIQGAQYGEIDYQGNGDHIDSREEVVMHTGKAVSFNFSLGYSF